MVLDITDCDCLHLDGIQYQWLILQQEEISLFLVNQGVGDLLPNTFQGHLFPPLKENHDHTAGII